MRLTLGTANFLKNYSLIQKDNLNPLYKKKLILKAKILGIKFIDTSPSYGNAEKIIGKTGVKIFKIITKIPKLPKSKINNISDWILKNLKNSLKNLNQKKIYALLIHDKSDFMNNKKNYLEAFNIIKRKDLVEKIGVSLYEAKDLNKIVKYWKPDIVQIPYNIIDRRIQNKKFINVIKKNSIELHVRSIFLKGMLVNQKVYPEAFNEWEKKINYWFKWCKNKKIKPSTAAFLFVKENKLIKNIVVGFDKIDQMIEIKKFENSKIKKFPHIKIHDRLFLNPHKWKLKMNNIIIIQARLNSKRLPFKVLLKIGNKRIIDLIYDRIKSVKTINDIIFAIPNNDLNKNLFKYLKNKGFKVFLGSHKNVLDRYFKAAKKYNADTIIRITADCPFADPKLIQEMHKFFMNHEFDYVSNTIYRTYPDGLDVEIFSFKALYKCWKNAKSSYNREHVTSHIITSKNFNKHNYEFKENLSKARLTLDCPEDYLVIKEIFNKFKKNYNLNWYKASKYYLKNFDFMKNKHLVKS